MEKKPKKITNLIPIIILAIVFFILYPVINQEISSGWVRSELYFHIFLNIVFLLSFSIYLYFSIRSQHWTQKYMISFSILSSIGFYYYVSLSYDPAFPTLAALSIITAIYIIPALIFIQLIGFIIKKKKP